MSKDNGDEQGPSPSSVGEEALRLMDAITNWAGEQASAHQNETSEPVKNTGAERNSPEHTCDEQHSPGVCRVCPICRIGTMLEAVQPEVIDRVADLIAMVAGSLHAAAEHRRAATSDGQSEPARTAPHTTSIPLTDAEPDQEELPDE